MPSRKTTSRPAGKRPAAAPAATRPPRRKPQAIPAVKSTSTDKEAKAAKPPKLRRKPVRDSFTMPEADFALIATLKARALSGRREAKKSELLRAGLHALAVLDTSGLIAALAQLEPVKIGRPKKGH